jgi:hypothetical protein
MSKFCIFLLALGFWGLQVLVSIQKNDIAFCLKSIFKQKPGYTPTAQVGIFSILAYLVF